LRKHIGEGRSLIEPVKTIALIIASIIIVPLGLLVLWVTEMMHNRKEKP
jgi:hypothetical protein